MRSGIIAPPAALPGWSPNWPPWAVVGRFTRRPEGQRWTTRDLAWPEGRPGEGTSPRGTRPGLAIAWNADGFGARSAKLEDYRSYTRDRRSHPGLKLFYDNDLDLMNPPEVLRLEPAPLVVNYQ